MVLEYSQCDIMMSMHALLADYMPANYLNRVAYVHVFCQIVWRETFDGQIFLGSVFLKYVKFMFGI